MSFDYSRLNKLEKHKKYYETDMEEYQKKWEQQQANLEAFRQRQAQQEQQKEAPLWDKVSWIASKNLNGMQGGVLNTISAIPQSMAVGYQRGAEQASKEQNDFDRLKNTGKNLVKMALGNDPASRMLYNLTIGRDDYINDLKTKAQQITENVEKAENGWQKAGAVIGGLTSEALQQSNLPLQKIYDQSQYSGQLMGTEKANETKEKLLNFDNNINKANDEWAEELEEESKDYGKVTKLIGNAAGSIGNMTPSIVMGTLGAGPGLTMTQMGLSAKAQTTRENLKQGLDLETAERKGVASGTAEAGSELMFNGLQAFKTFKKSGVEEVAKDWIKKTVENNIKSAVGQKVTKGIGNWLIDVTGESIEELTTDIYNTWLDNATNDPNKQYTLEDAKNTVLSTVLSTTGLNAGTTVLQKASNKLTNIDNTQDDQQNTENKNQAMNQYSLQEQQNATPFEYVKSDNAKIDTLRKEMSQNFNNSEQTQNFANVLEKVVEDKGYNIRFDNKLTDEKGNVANGRIKTLDNGEVEITLNPNSNRAGEFILTHEITHAVATQEMRDMVQEHMKKDAKFADAVKSLQEVYKTNEISDEVLADVSGQLFGNQEFINQLSMEKPTFFKKIYNKIIEIANKITGYSNEARFIADLKNKWEEAYRNNYNNSSDTQYFIEPVANFNETEYNNVIEERLDKQEYAILRSIINSDSNIKPGINYVDVTNGRYTVYYKGIDDFKVMSKEVDEDAGRISPRDDKTRRDTRYSKSFEQNIKNRATTTYNDGISEINTKGTYKRSGSDSSSSTNIENIESQEGSFNLPENYKQQQLDIINKENPMTDDYHTGIRDVKDIQTYQEAVNNDDSLDTGITPDFTGKDIQKALDTGKITVYSSYPIEQGVFVTPSKMEAQNYAGNNQVYSKEVNLNDVAWIDSLQGQYAKVDNKVNQQPIVDSQGRTLTTEQQEFFKDSKVLDRNGKLMTLYHGTSNDFNVFNIQKLGTGQKNAGNYGDGFYFTPSKNQANDYAKDGKIKEVYLDIKNPFIYSSLGEINGENIFSDYVDIYNLVNLNSEWGNIPIKFGSKQTWNDIKNAVQDYIDSGKDIYSIDEKMNEDFGDIAEQRLNDRIYRYSKDNGYKTLKDILKEKGYDGIFSDTFQSDNTQYIAFNPNQIKNVDNLNPTDNPDIRYQKENKNWQEYIENKFPNKGTRTNFSDIKVPMAKKQDINVPTVEELKTTKGEAVDYTQIENPGEKKFRKHYKSIIESSNTTAEAKAVAKEMMGLDTYVPDSNKNQLQRADERISTNGVENSLNTLNTKLTNGDKITATDIAIGERLIEYYSKTGNKEQLQEAIQTTAMMGTQAGQTVQALALLNHMTPQGQVTWIQRSVDKINKELQQKYKNKKNIPQFELTSDMINKVMKTEGNQEAMYKAIEEVYEELGQQVPKTHLEQLDEWRYFSMLANIKTHGRNVIGNVAMHGIQRFKDKVAGGIEGVVAKFNSDMERTHTLRKVSEETKNFTKEDLKNTDVQTMLGMNENKYNPQSRIQSARRTFKSDIAEKTLGRAFDVNSNLLEVEDNIGLKAMYTKALGEYLTANKIDVNNITDKQLAKARNYAVQAAKEATFHQASALATALNQMGSKNGIAKFALDAVVPFKKTPINVAKTGIQYSPVGLMKSAVYDIPKLRRGDITVNQYIDNISKGLTGTGITFLGYALAQAGIIKASGGDDDKKEKYDEEQGKQSYSIQIGDKTYSLDWLAPAGIPLFVGAEINQQFNQTKKEKNTKSNDDNEVLTQIASRVANVANGTANAMNPMSEMSMISGLTSVLASYNKENAIGDMIVNTGKSYVNQYVPTLVGQIARTSDEYERSTKSTKTGTLEKAIDQTKNQIISKIPGARQALLPIKTDIWGNDVKQEANLPLRALNNFVNPSTVKNVSTDKIDAELNKLYDETGEGSILPSIIDKTYTIDNKKYRMTNEEYSKAAKEYGKNAYTLLDNLISSKQYKNLTNAQKQTAIENVYSYAKEKNKIKYADLNNLNVDNSTLYKTLEKLGQSGEGQGQYLGYLAKIGGLTKDNEKNEILKNSNYSNKTKAIIYENGTGSDDEFYNVIAKNSPISINDYLKYKIANANGEFKADKDKNNESISGTAKKKLADWLDNNISNYEAKLLIMANNYKLQDANDVKALTDYINKQSNNIEIFKKLTNNYKYKNGKVYYK